MAYVVMACLGMAYIDGMHRYWTSVRFGGLVWPK